MRRWLNPFLSTLLLLCLISETNGETIYFLVGEISPSHNDSYVLPLSDANAIAHARDLIKYGPGIGQTIIVANISCGTDGINRDYLAPYKPRWNWHVTNFNDFAGVTAEILDGWPGFVESDCEWWINNTGGYIGFWSYTVVAELGTDPRPWRCNFDSDDDVDLEDFAWFSKYWLRQDCNSSDWCDGTDLDSSSTVDYNDLAIFARNWLSPFAAEPLWFDCWDCPTQCHGDADCDGTVSTVDLFILKFTFPLPAIYPSFNYDACADFNRDFRVDANDMSILNLWWLASPPADCQ